MSDKHWIERNLARLDALLRGGVIRTVDIWQGEYQVRAQHGIPSATWGYDPVALDVYIFKKGERGTHLPIDLFVKSLRSSINFDLRMGDLIALGWSMELPCPAHNVATYIDDDEEASGEPACAICGGINPEPSTYYLPYQVIFYPERRP